MATTASALEHVQEVVGSQQQPVTCLSLSAALAISSDGARKVLETYLAQHPGAGALYAVTGKVKGAADNLSMVLIGKEKLAETTAKFEAPDVQLYSISPAAATTAGQSDDVASALTNLWGDDLRRVKQEISQCTANQELWRPGHLPDAFCAAAAREKRDFNIRILVNTKSNGGAIPSPMNKPPVPGTKPAAVTATKPAPGLPKASQPDKKPEDVPDISKVKLTDKTPGEAKAGSKRKAPCDSEATDSKTTKTSMSGGYLIMEDVAPSDQPSSDTKMETETVQTTTETSVEKSSVEKSESTDEKKKEGGSRPKIDMSTAGTAVGVKKKKGQGDDKKQTTLQGWFTKKKK